MSSYSVEITPETVSAEYKRVVWNCAIDKAQEVIAEWLAQGRDETELFDKLQDLKIWTTQQAEK